MPFVPTESLEKKISDSVDKIYEVYNARIYDETSLLFDKSYSFDQGLSKIKNYVKGYLKIISKRGNEAYNLFWDFLSTTDNEVKKNLILSDLYAHWIKVDRRTSSYIFSQYFRPLHTIFNCYKLTSIYYASKAYFVAEKKIDKYHSLLNILDNSSWIVLRTNVFDRSSIFYELEPFLHLVISSYALIKRMKLRNPKKYLINKFLGYLSWHNRKVAYLVSLDCLNKGPLFDYRDSSDSVTVF